MSQGLEQFGTGWKNNQHYINNFTDDAIDSCGFIWVPIGELNTQTNGYSTISTFIGPNFGLKLAVVVKVALGVSLVPIVVTITYHNQSGHSNTVTCTFPQGSASGTCKVAVLPGGEQISNITIASATPTTSGTIQFWGPLNSMEMFDNSMWGSPDPGL